MRLMMHFTTISHVTSYVYGASWQSEMCGLCAEQLNNAISEGPEAGQANDEADSTAARFSSVS